MKRTFCISRTDSIGDVVLTLPMAGYLKQKFPDSKILFLAKKYTSAIVALSKDIDEIIIYDHLEKLEAKEIAENLMKYQITDFIHVFPNKKLARAVKIANIQNRIGTSHRLFHLLTCNKRVDFTRRKSNLHESQLNFKLIEPLIRDKINPSLDNVISNLNIENQASTNFSFEGYGIIENRKKIILHPKSQGSAVEWGVSNFIELIQLFQNKDCDVIITGTEEESLFFRDQLPDQENLYDLSGKLTLEQLVTLIQKSDFLVAASTGPLHIAAILDKYALGLYSPRKPIHPGRWQPIGINADYLVFDHECQKCIKGHDCNCISKLEALQVYYKLEDMAKITF
jgi:ADP-heptose:LPS heptosyltransferase